jgi:hypothetical protein
MRTIICKHAVVFAMTAALAASVATPTLAQYVGPPVPTVGYADPIDGPAYNPAYAGAGCNCVGRSQLERAN